MKISKIFTSAVLFLMLGVPAFSASDSSAVDANAMAAAVKSSSGVMIRVPVDAQGRELAAASELRVVSDVATASDSAKLPEIWAKGVDATSNPQVDSSTNSDSSTNRWGWNTWRPYNYGWYNSYYYNYYTPGYYYNGYTWNYGAPYYYNYYNPYVYNNVYPAWGWRYYYYPRGW